MVNPACQRSVSFRFRWFVQCAKFANFLAKTRRKVKGLDVSKYISTFRSLRGTGSVPDTYLLFVFHIFNLARLGCIESHCFSKPRLYVNLFFNQFGIYTQL